MSGNQESLNKLPAIGITIGDAAGIGPEIVLKALADRQSRQTFRPVVICDERFLLSQAGQLGLTLDESTEIVDLGNLPSPVRPGEETADTGRASGEYIEKAVELWRTGAIDAVATAP